MYCFLKQINEIAAFLIKNKIQRDYVGQWIDTKLELDQLVDTPIHIHSYIREIH